MIRPFSALILILTTLLATQQPPPPLRLTEIFYDTPGDDGQEEWVEIANLGTAVIPLGNIKLGDEEKAGGSEGMFRFPAAAEIAGGQIIVVAQTAVGFAQLYGRFPDYELQDSHPDIPNMRRFPLWASDAFALGNSGDELLLLGERNELLDGLNYGDSLHFFSPAIGSVVTGQSIERVPASCDSDTAADWQPQSSPTPGTLSNSGDCATPAPTPAAETLPPIGSLQGNGDRSPLLNQLVSFRGIVTGSHADRNASGITFYTLFVQDLPEQADGDPATSDGIALFLGRKRPFAEPGDLVRVTGQMTEFFGLTEIDDNNIQIDIEASGLPLPEPIPLPSSFTALEHLEGMRVMLAETAVVTNPTFRSCGFNVSLTNERSFRRATSDTTPPSLPILHHSESDTCGDFPQLKTGDQVSGLVGPLTYHFDEYKIVQQQPNALRIDPAPLPPLPPSPTLGDNQMSIATFNMENLFDGIDDTGDAAEPKLSAAVLAGKLNKIGYAIAHTLGCPTLLGVQEVEKEELLRQLAEQLTADCGFTYAVSHQESVDVRGIDVALLSDPRRVVVQTAVLQQGCTRLNTGIVDAAANCPSGEEPLFSRPPLVVALTVAEVPMTLLVNHFKSKRGGEAETAPRRLAQANHINRLVNAILAADSAANIIVLGDFNDFERSPSTQAMVAPNGRLTSALALIPDSSRYSFVFGGAAQLIDDILLSPSLAQRPITAVIQHSNADFPFGWEADQARLAYRATDHDLPLVVLSLAAEPTPIEPTATQFAEPTATVMPNVTEEKERPFSQNWLVGGAGLLLLASGIWLFYRKSDYDG